MMIPLLFWLSVAMILYVYFGYPILLGVLASLRPKPSAYPNHTPRVTLLIAAYNEAEVITQKLQNTVLLDYPREKLQILVAADGSTDETANIVSGYQGRSVELSYSPERHGKMAAINNAMAKARGEIIVMSDANNLYSPQTIKELVKPFYIPEIGAVSGAKHIIEGDGRLGESEGLYWNYEAWIKEQETRLGCCTAVSGEIYAFRSKLYAPPPDEIINDDFYMLMNIVKKGYRAVYVPEAQSYERISLTSQDEIERRTRMVAGRFQAIALAGKLLPSNRPLIVWQVISHKFMRPLIPFAMMLMFVTSLLSVFWPASPSSPIWMLTNPYNWILFLSQLLFYFIAWLGNYVSLPKVLYLPTFLVNSNLAAFLGLIRFITRRQDTLWKRAKRREDIAPTGAR